ncbi:hypothetical protein ACFQU2_20265 [Siccirubricoccus deserti]
MMSPRFSYHRQRAERGQRLFLGQARQLLGRALGGEFRELVIGPQHLTDLGPVRPEVDSRIIGDDVLVGRASPPGGRMAPGEPKVAAS